MSIELGTVILLVHFFEIKPLCFKAINEQENVNEKIILCTSSYDSDLEVFKTNIKI